MKKKAFLDLGFLRSTSSSKPPPELEEPRHNTRLTIKTGEDHRAEHLPAPLPVAPPTGLSFSDNIDRSYYQEHSPLFKLPFELREKIYLDTLGHNCIHVTCTRKRLAHIRCPYRAVVKRMSTLGHDCWGYTAEEGLIFLRAASGKHSKHGSLMGIVRSCRRAYAESLQFLYAYNHFDFIHPGVLELFKAYTPPESFRSIRSIQLNRCIPSIPWCYSYRLRPEVFYLDKNGEPHFEEVFLKGDPNGFRLSDIIYDLE